MRTKTIFDNKKIIITIYLCLLGLMIVGSFADYPISLALYDESNWFGILFAAYGEIPATLGMIVAGTFFISAHNRQKKAIGYLQIIGGGIVILLGTLMVCFMPTIYLFNTPHIVIYIIGLVLSILTIIFSLKLVKNSDRKMVIKVGLVFLISIMGIMIVVNMIKVPWGRARMRLVANNPEAYFMPWWQVGGSLKETLIAEGVAAEEFKSFPSGHVSNATAVLLLSLLPLLNDKLKGKEKTIFGCGVVWIVLVMISRIIIGAHYLTDDVVAFAVGLAVILIVCKIAFKPKKA